MKYSITDTSHPTSCATFLGESILPQSPTRKACFSRGGFYILLCDKINWGIKSAAPKTSFELLMLRGPDHGTYVGKTGTAKNWHGSWSSPLLCWPIPHSTRYYLGYSLFLGRDRSTLLWPCPHPSLGSCIRKTGMGLRPSVSSQSGGA